LYTVTGYSEVNYITGTSSHNCSTASVRVLDSDGTILIPRSCGTLSKNTFTSSGSNLTLIVDSVGGNGTVLNFTAHYTSYSTGGDVHSDVFSLKPFLYAGL